MANFSYSNNGLALTKSFEGLETTAYQDQGGVWTIGYGHTRNVQGGTTITEDQAEQLLEGDLAGAVAAVNKGVTAEISQNQFDAMVDFTFNLGAANFLTSTLLRKVNAGDFAGAAAEFPKWDHLHGVEIPGLLRRRNAEMALFQTA